MNIEKSIILLKQELQPDKLLPNITAGLVNGTIGVIIATSFAALMFSGNLAPYIGVGIGTILFSTIVLRGVTAIFSSLPGVIADTDALPSAIYALMATTISQKLTPGATEQEIFLHILVAIALSSIFTGTFLLGLGIFKLGDFVRFIPYPVVGGFLAGSGWLLVQGSIQVMTDVALDWKTIPYFFQFDKLLMWLPGIIFAVLLVLASRRFDHFFLMPGSLIAATTLFYLVVWLNPISFAEVRAQGWLLGPFPKGNLWQPLHLSDFVKINWSVIMPEASGIITIMVISAATILLNATGLELLAKRDINFNQELKAAGIANILCGLGGGMVGYHVLSDTALAYKMGAKSRTMSLVTVVVCLIVLIQGPTLLSYCPKEVLGGLLAFLGLLFLLEWLYDGWFKFAKVDYFIILLIVVAIGLLGFLQGVAVGLAVAIVLFVINCSSMNVTKRTFSGVTYHSNVLRASDEERLLREHGEQIYIVELQGLLFFGTANKLVNQIRDRLKNTSADPVGFILLDFRLINGIDSSAVLSFANLKRITNEKEIHLLFINLKSDVVRQLRQGDCLDDDDKFCHIFADLDRGLEWCEERILSENKGDNQQDYSWRSQLEKVLEYKQQAAKLMNYLQPVYLQVEEVLFRQGDSFNGLYFVETGRVSVIVELANNQTKRIRSYLSGNTIGEMGLYRRAPRMASVVADRDSLLYFLSSQAFEQMEREDFQLAASFHKFIVISLAERLNHREQELKSLLQ
ncbi:SLC26A/SulP transporter family protein [Calothrix sp. FACHB-1219]|uniref:SLC26A/SulP transporter family protein n=1 Tax=unclassified Calothrix TaxID=2619626 RepID=UPI00168644DC|nr:MULTISPECIES: SulP family inorganic anion transporter [unclassified Calothrix]MBD2206460.1 SLC26A/SulP transporter family protein [Calothrix sp. FACHB-168]MBD2220337.1 SLC26A/SulP transporter family protein [Calothrix sp. FACHB-1219]